MSKLRMFIVIGTRPEAIKLAPVIRNARSRDCDVETLVCLTGQHRQLVDEIVDYFQIAPDFDLQLMREGQSLAELASRLLVGLDKLLDDYAPNCVVVQGDTSTAMVGALAAFYRRIPVIHVEAGLRTGDLQAPWPEEMHRRVASVATTLHCAPTESAAQRLLAEGYPPEQVHVTGNPVIDALYWALQKEGSAQSPWRRKYAAWSERRMVLITGHRRESIGSGIADICQAVRRLAKAFPQVEFVYPVHHNPAVRRTVFGELAGYVNVHLLESAPYPEFVWLLNRSTFIISDSGGIQEEAPALGRFVLVTRNTTERPEAVATGSAELVGTDPDQIFNRAQTLLLHPTSGTTTCPFGNGRAAERIINLALSTIPAASKAEGGRRSPRRTSPKPPLAPLFGSNPIK